MLVGAAAVAAYFLFQGASTLNSLVFLAKGVTMQNGFLQLTLGIQNPTSNALTIQSLAGNILVNGSAFGNISNFVPTVIAANSETDMVLNIAASPLGIAAGLVNELESSGTNLSVAAQGVANVNGQPIPVSLTFM